ncbi:S8 family serine peptidase [Kribbella sp. NPDC050124]|uniref:S8 family serine peptidase n=1 Tax=Kribbella sp. NPDC050124 TaxID=3364114 RepID=UPI003793428A
MSAVGLVSVLVATVLGATSPSLATAFGGRTMQTGDYIIVLDEGTDASAVATEHARRYGVTAGHVYGYALHGYSAQLTARAATRIAADPRVASIHPDRVVTSAAQPLPTGIDRVDAEASPTAGIDGVDTRVDVDVAVIDTGVDLRHPDLNVVRAKNCSSERGSNDQNGHGTHVAGIVGALDNNVGVTGVAPGARIWSVRVLKADGSGLFSDVICGIDFVTANASRIEVANMSLGGFADDSTCGTGVDVLHEAICTSVASGVTYVVAAGNNYGDAGNIVPATYDEVITVSALADFDGRPGGLGGPTCAYDVDDTLADFSNTGTDIDLIAPGLCIHSTWNNGGYNTISGTSMASPHAAGAAALYLANHPGSSPTTVKSALQAAGTTDWNNIDDRDGLKEKLVNVASF